MAWKLEFKNKHFKFLNKQDIDTQNRIRNVLKSLLDYLDKGILPFSEMDIRKLRGKREGFMRLRIGKIRIIFKIDMDLKKIKIYAVEYRGDIYKR